MAIESTTFGISSIAEKFENYDARLQAILLRIHLYLFKFGNNWLYSTLRKNYFHKCNKSWGIINESLDRFIDNPRDNYSALMTVLEQERQRFPSHSYYGKQLRELADFIAAGPALKRPLEHSSNEEQAQHPKKR